MPLEAFTVGNVQYLGYTRVNEIASRMSVDVPLHVPSKFNLLSSNTLFIAIGRPILQHFFLDGIMITIEVTGDKLNAAGLILLWK